MQRCSKCGRTYENDTQKFCTHDGGRLTPDDAAARGQAQTTYDLNQSGSLDAYDPEVTVQRMPDLNKTVMTTPTSEIRSKETGPAATPPPPSAPTYPPPPSPPSSTSEQPTVAYNQSQPLPLPQQQQYYQPPPPYAPPMQPQPHQPQYAPAPPQQQQQRAPQAPAAVRGKSSRVPLIIGLVVILLAGAAAAWYFLIYKKNNAGANANTNSTSANSNTTANANSNTNGNTNANDNSNTTANANTNTTPPSTPPANSMQFVNSKANLDGKLAEKYSDFSFSYPNTWQRDPKSGVAGASNFVRVERRLPPDFTQENFTVSWYDSQGTLEADQENVFPKLAKSLEDKLSKSYPEFKVLSEGGTTINALNGYEIRFQSVSRGTEKGDITLWGWVVFLPPGKEGATNGLQLLMLTTSLAPELKSASDVGVKGELPMILNSFRMGSS
jgi:hypothetical protein